MPMKLVALCKQLRNARASEADVLFIVVLKIGKSCGWLSDFAVLFISQLS